MAQKEKSLPYGALVLSGLILSIFGWVGLFFIVVYTLPTLGPRWLFFFLLMTALSGTALPFVVIINLRFPSKPPADAGTFLRQAMWVGIYGDLLIWLQQGRVLTSNIALYILLGFVVLEIILRVREQARWRPEDAPHG